MTAMVLSYLRRWLDDYRRRVVKSRAIWMSVHFGEWPGIVASKAVSPIFVVVLGVYRKHASTRLLGVSFA
jgi:hypothetical protein